MFVHKSQDFCLTSSIQKFLHTVNENLWTLLGANLNVSEGPLGVSWRVNRFNYVQRAPPIDMSLLSFLFIAKLWCYMLWSSL